MASITAAQLEDPLGIGEGEQRAKSLAIIINQYPTGLTDEELQVLLDSQTSIETAREAIDQPLPQEPIESYEPDYYYEEPVYSQPTYPPVEETPPPTSDIEEPVRSYTTFEGRATAPVSRKYIPTLSPPRIILLVPTLYLRNSETHQSPISFCGSLVTNSAFKP